MAACQNFCGHKSALICIVVQTNGATRPHNSAELNDLNKLKCGLNWASLCGVITPYKEVI